MDRNSKKDEVQVKAVYVAAGKADVSDIVPCCANGCDLTSVYTKVPDCLGCYTNGTCCCCMGESKFCKPAKDPAECCICTEQRYACIYPTTCCKTIQQTCCLDSRCAFPCDRDVPCVCSCCYLTWCYNFQPKFACCTRLGSLDPSLRKVGTEGGMMSKLGGMMDDAANFDPPNTGNASPPSQDVMLLAMKAAAISKLAYIGHGEDKEEKQKETNWIEALQIQNHKEWFAELLKKKDLQDTVKNKNDSGNSNVVGLVASKGLEYVPDKFIGGARAITGTISNLSKEMSSSTFFVAFRGTTSINELISDLASVDPVDLVTSKGKKIGETGKGMNDHLHHIRELKKDGKSFIETIATGGEKCSNGVLICGHSLGAAVATLLAAELKIDYPKLKIHLVTFGCPRVLGKEASEKHHYEVNLETNFRFVNSGDMICILGNEMSAKIAKAGEQAGAAMYAKFGGAKHEKDEKPVVSLFHIGNAVYSPHEKKGNEWLIVEATKTKGKDPSYNWANDPNGVMTGAAAIGTFTKQLGKAHKLDTETGYVDFITRSKTYQSALASLDPSVKKTFESIPWEIK